MSSSEDRTDGKEYQNDANPNVVAIKREPKEIVTKHLNTLRFTCAMYLSGMMSQTQALYNNCPHPYEEKISGPNFAIFKHNSMTTMMHIQKNFDKACVFFRKYNPDQLDKLKLLHKSQIMLMRMLDKIKREHEFSVTGISLDFDSQAYHMRVETLITEFEKIWEELSYIEDRFVLSAITELVRFRRVFEPINEFMFDGF